MNAKRGYVPEDEKNFSQESLAILRKASRHIRYLINEGYALKQATVFTGNHYQLSDRQRLALMRSLAVFCKSLLQKVAKPFCRLLHLQNVGDCRRLCRQDVTGRIAIADIVNSYSVRVGKGRSSSYSSCAFSRK